MTKATLYDKTGAAFSFDHEHDGMAYVRPLMKMVVQSSYGDDFSEDEDFEPAGYLVAMDRSDLFDTLPLAAVNADFATKLSELDALKTEAEKAIRDLSSQRTKAESGLRLAKQELDRWMETHRVMIDLGKLLDGQVLYPLSVRENSYHHGREIPVIPEMRYAKYLAIHSGDFEKGQKWIAKQYGTDTYGSPFQFFNTKEERDAVIQSEFDETCQKFRGTPNFDVDIYTTTRLHYGTLLEWVKTHPALTIPDDIKAMKAANDAALVEQRKANLAAELAAIEATPTPA